MSKRDRQPVRTAEDVERKYNLGGQGKRINEARKLAENARSEAQKVIDQAKQEFQRKLDDALEEMGQSATNAENAALEAEKVAQSAEQMATEAKNSAAEAVQTANSAQETAEMADTQAYAAYNIAISADATSAEAKEIAEDAKANNDSFDRRIQDVEKKSQDNEDIIADLPTKNWVFNSIYPVGSIYLAYNHTNPGMLFPGTEWERIEGAFPWFTGATGTIGQTGGERTVTLTEEQIPSHNHGGTYTNAGTATKTHAWLASGGSAMAYDIVNTGGGEAHNNMPPYIQISAWRRTA